LAISECSYFWAFLSILMDFSIARYYIYFTRLSYVGLTTYFSAAAFQTGIFVLSLRQVKSPEVTREPGFPLQGWGRFLQFLHLYLFSTIITFRKWISSRCHV
jgi:hypothetical protein